MLNMHIGPVHWGRRGRRKGALQWAMLCMHANANEHMSTQVGKMVAR
jgi:hypothetical protein